MSTGYHGVPAVRSLTLTAQPGAPPHLLARHRQLRSTDRAPVAGWLHSEGAAALLASDRVEYLELIGGLRHFVRYRKLPGRALEIDPPPYDTIEWLNLSGALN